MRVEDFYDLLDDLVATDALCEVCNLHRAVYCHQGSRRHIFLCRLCLDQLAVLLERLSEQTTTGDRSQ